ncbi:MAG: FAD:protein FMN transferase [Clostridia bacterium]|nr:FAD:protein FMN transferase [Clostridia bacterium]
MKKYLFLPLLIILCACSPHPEKQTSFAMDTVMDFTVYNAEISPLVELVNEYDAIFSPTRSDSELSTYNEGNFSQNEIFTDLLEKAEFYRKKTNGAFDHTLGDLIDLWNVGEVPANDAIETAKGGDKVNLSAIVKGAVSDALVAHLNRSASSSAIISLGGNIVAFGSKPDGKPWIVGIRDPKGDSNAYLGTVGVSDKFVVSSGDYERFFEKDGVRYHHILDGSTGFPAKSDLRGVTIIADNGTLSDVYSTALFVMGYEKALEFWKNSNDFEAIFVFDDKVVVTEGVPDFKLTNKEYSYEVAYR